MIFLQLNSFLKKLFPLLFDTRLKDYISMIDYIDSIS
jgi:hypothetical protein